MTCSLPLLAWLGAEQPPQNLEELIRRLHDGDQQRVEQTLRSAWADGAHFILTFRAGDFPRVFQAQGFVQRNDAGEKLRVIAFVTDLSVQSAAQDEVAAAQQRSALAARIGRLIAWEIDAETSEIVYEPELPRLFGLPDGAAPRSADEFVAQVHPDDVSATLGALSNALRPGGRYEAEFRVRHPEGGWRRLRGCAEGVLRQGRVKIIGFNCDVTESHDANERLRQREAAALKAAETASRREQELRAMADAMPQLVWSANEDGQVDFYNSRVREYRGLEARADKAGQEIWQWSPVVHADDLERTVAAWEKAKAGAGAYECEHRLAMEDGGFRWHVSRASPMRDAGGHAVRWYGTATDIHDLKSHQEAQELLSEELRHRIKNIFAVVQSLVSLSARQAPQHKEFAQGLLDRISALYRAHELAIVLEDGGKPARGRLLDLVRELILPYAADDRRLVVEGDDLPLAPRAATAFSLLIHELATNAAKYGSLSATGGALEVRTRTDADGNLVLQWRETGGPLVAGPPEREGFGARLASISVERQLGGTMQKTWRAEGLFVELTTPVDRLGAI